MWCPFVLRSSYDRFNLKYFTVVAERDKLAEILVDTQNALNKYKLAMGQGSLATKKLIKTLD